MAKTFTAAIDAWAKKADARMEAVFKEAVQLTIEDAQRVVSEGGRMRVDTNFLRASGQASLNALPTGPSRNEGGTFTYRSEDTDLVIGRATLDDVIFFGWTANYARPREYIDGFMRGAAQRWQANVTAVVAEAKRRFP